MTASTIDPAATRERDRRFVWHPYQPTDRWLDPPFEPPVIAEAEGVWLTTAEGDRLIDGVGSWWVSNLGHGHPRVRAAMHEQLDRMCHVAMAGLVHEPAVQLAERLVAATPPGLDHVFYSDDGSTAVEVAIRAAFQYWQQNGAPERTVFLSLAGAYHGDTIGTVSVGGIPLFHRVFGPLTFETIQVPSPAVRPDDDWHVEAFDALETRLRAEAHRVAAVVIEPLVQGAAGMLMYPPSYLARLRALCDELDVFLIADEVFVGFGRTGTLFACEQAGITPDLMCLSKGLTGGALPFAATLATGRIFDGFRGGGDRTFFYGHSYCGNPLACAAANAVLDAFEQDDVLAASHARAEEMADALARIGEHPGVSRTRQTGLIGAVQLGDGSSDYASELGWRVYKAALDRGAYLRPLGNVIYFVPALTIEPDELAQLMSIAEAAITEATPA